MKDAEHDKINIKEALDNTREKRLNLETKVAEARAVLNEADQKLQIAKDELNECYTEIANLKSQWEQENDQLHITPSASQCLGKIPALYEEGFMVYYW